MLVRGADELGHALDLRALVQAGEMRDGLSLTAVAYALAFGAL